MMTTAFYALSHMDYFGRYDLLPQWVSASACIIDALDGVTGGVRIIPPTGASVYGEATTPGRSMIAARRRRNHR
jgi:hypothetical protein